jgi:hypothetical protein
MSSPSRTPLAPDYWVERKKQKQKIPPHQITCHKKI